MESFASAVVLKRGREESVERRHPWIFSGAIARRPAELAVGDLVRVVSAAGRFLGMGHYLGGNIAVKLYSFEEEVPFGDLILRRLAEAQGLRNTIDVWNESTAYRLVHGEGDGLPGLIVDRYGETLVVQFQSEGMARARDEIVAGLRYCLGNEIVGIFAKPFGEEGGQGSYLWGEGGERVIQEHGLSYEVDWERGQKTGFYLDQRTNRALVREFAAGKRVLNAFSYTGAFSAAALAGGATSALSLDTSESALAMAQANMRRNGLGERHSVLRADAFRYLMETDERFDLVVLDPPAFAKHREAVRSGEKGYVTINREALRIVEPGGLLFTFSCSQLVSRTRFRELLLEATLKSSRDVTVLMELHQAPCHPVRITCPESEYLKGLLLLVG